MVREKFNDVQNLIKPSKSIFPQIYAYTTPDNQKMVGWVKIGYTERKDVKERIKEQTHTANIDFNIEWKHPAYYFDTHKYFTDYDFHHFLEAKGIVRDPGTEWFDFKGNIKYSEELFKQFAFKSDYQVSTLTNTSYKLRDEQEEAVLKTIQYAKNHLNGEFLWNAKPRFGKTLATYDFMTRMDYKNILIVTNRPAIANSWYEDFEKFIANNGKNYLFVSELDALRKTNALSRDEYINELQIHMDTSKSPRQVAFISLQDLKGSKYVGGAYDKLDWIVNLDWDLLVIDEAHEGIDTIKTDVAFNKINRKFTLHLSGTPFKALSNGKFGEDQIYNWSYLDEQTKKEKMKDIDDNPYRNLPEMQLFTYKMSNAIGEDIQHAHLDEDQSLSFDLAEFFSAEEINSTTYRFKHEKEVKKWIETLTSNEKYPFSTKKLRDELKHTYWRFDRVNSAKAMKQLLEVHPVFENYHIIVAAGDGKTNESDEKKIRAYEEVKKSIKQYEKTITLSVGQLSTGVTVPEWSAVLMLCNLSSPSEYIQTAFRAQNPWQYEENNNIYRKECAYIFDFAPHRTLQIYDAFANDLSNHYKSDVETKQQNIKQLLNFFPVIAEDNDGEMIELNSQEVLSLPQKIKADSVVSHGFMDNLLFSNIHHIFNAPTEIREILSNTPVADKGKVHNENLRQQPDVNIDEEGNIDVSKDVNQTYDKLFGDKVYDVVGETSNEIKKSFKEQLNNVVNDVSSNYKISTKSKNAIVKKINDDMNKKMTKLDLEIKAEKNIIQADYKQRIKDAVTIKQRDELKQEKDLKLQNLNNKKEEKILSYTNNLMSELPKKLVEQQEKIKQNNKKEEYEEEIRAHLRGFSRTIPSFIMAYGNRNLTLQNFDKQVPEDVFEEVTGITLEQFRLLRDGGMVNQTFFKGQLFDELVFNKSIQTFLDKKEQLANYFDNQDEDIFDYIPPQQTNQIYTPKKLVCQMVEALEKENPMIFDDSSKTFIDLYMKSGLYITEIIKRLYKSDKIKQEFPDDQERLKHILENQVYGFAPTKIIYNISTSFIFGNTNSISKKNFVCEDTFPYAKEGKITELIDKYFD